MTTLKIETITRKGGRWYVHPITGLKRIGITSVLRMLPKPFFHYWAAKMGITAGAAFGATAVAIGTKGVMAFAASRTASCASVGHGR